MDAPFTVFAVVHGGSLAMDAVLLMASIRANDPNRTYEVILAEPRPGPLWPADQALRPDTRALLEALGARIVPFDVHHFGQAWPYGNKIEALAALPPGRPFVFLDTDTLVLRPLGDVPFDFDRPTASLRRQGTWPIPQPDGASLATIWESLYRRFNLDFASSQDSAYPIDDWRRYLYFNAGFWFYRDPAVFMTRFVAAALSIRDDPPPELAGQSLDPWLDQVALPLVIHGLGGGRDTLPAGLIDGSHTCHWRKLPLLYARESDGVVEMLERITAPNRIKKVLKSYSAAHQLIYRGQGRVLRKRFQHLAQGDEIVLRKALRAVDLWDV